MYVYLVTDWDASIVCVCDNVDDLVKNIKEYVGSHKYWDDVYICDKDGKRKTDEDFIVDAEYLNKNGFNNCYVAFHDKERPKKIKGLWVSRLLLNKLLVTEDI